MTGSWRLPNEKDGSGEFRMPAGIRAARSSHSGREDDTRTRGKVSMDGEPRPAGRTTQEVDILLCWTGLSSRFSLLRRWREWLAGQGAGGLSPPLLNSAERPDLRNGVQLAPITRPCSPPPTDDRWPMPRGGGWDASRNPSENADAMTSGGRLRARGWCLHRRPAACRGTSRAGGRRRGSA